MVHGRYGQFQVDVDGEIVIDAGALAFLGVLPSSDSVLQAVRERLQASGPPKEPPAS